MREEGRTLLHLKYFLLTKRKGSNNSLDKNKNDVRQKKGNLEYFFEKDFQFQLLFDK